MYTNALMHSAPPNHKSVAHLSLALPNWNSANGYSLLKRFAKSSTSWQQTLSDLYRQCFSFSTQNTVTECCNRYGKQTNTNAIRKYAHLISMSTLILEHSISCYPCYFNINSVAVGLWSGYMDHNIKYSHLLLLRCPLNLVPIFLHHSTYYEFIQRF